MKKNTVRAGIVLAVLLVVYHVVIFAIPFPKTPVFFLSWLCTLVAILAQIYVMQTAFGQGEDAKSKFYGFPIARVGLMYLVAQLLLGLVFMAVGWVVTVPIWIPILLYVVLLGATVVGFIGVNATRDEIVRQDIKLEKDVSAMRAIQSKAASLPTLTKDETLKKALTTFAEAVRFSDPVSSNAVQEIEGTLAACVDDLERALVEEDAPSAAELVEKATAILTERNRLCKLSKTR